MAPNYIQTLLDAQMAAFRANTERFAAAHAIHQAESAQLSTVTRAATLAARFYSNYEGKPA